MQAPEYRRECVFAGLMAVLSAALLAQSYSYDPDSSQFPRFLAWLMALFTALETAKLVRGRRAVVPGAAASPWPWLAAAAAVCAVAVLYAAGIVWIGFYPSTVLALAAFMAYFGRGAGLSWKVCALVVVGYLAVVHLMFSVFLGTNLPVGELFQDWWEGGE